jgi:DNA-binding transcriptional LysR family regulator
MELIAPGLRPARAGDLDTLASSFATTYAGVVAFMTVVAEGSFTKAGDRLGIGRSSVSRSIRKLETQLGARLLSRTTRNLALTREGEVFHTSCFPGIAHISQALDDVRDLRDGPPRGRLRVCANAAFGRKIVGALLWDFNTAYPAIEIELILDDDPALDLISNRIDVAFRNGRLEDSQLVARQIVPMQQLLCATPGYAKRHGLPEALDELPQHECISFRLPSGRMHEWELQERGAVRKFEPQSRLTFNDAELVLQAVLQGRGIAQLPAYQVCTLLRQGRLVTCLPQYAPEDGGHYVCYQSRQHLPSRIRVFVDHMTTAIRGLDLQCAAEFVPAEPACSVRRIPHAFGRRLELAKPTPDRAKRRMSQNA